jgi:hypothetical protein
MKIIKNVKNEISLPSYDGWTWRFGVCYQIRNTVELGYSVMKGIAYSVSL